MSNGPSKAKNIEKTLQEIGELIGDPYEISNLRRDDYEAVKRCTEYEDLLQCEYGKKISRNHQFAGAFLVVGSGLEDVLINKILI